MEHTPDDNGLKSASELRRKIRERIKFLENRIVVHRKHPRQTTGRDETELDGFASSCNPSAFPW